ncbi:MAG TPA: carbonic anhydrase [Bryobacteraceae bacterium]|nr:carbonic anhydrase [Bryobacteraceae bacterium]
MLRSVLLATAIVVSFFGPAPVAAGAAAEISADESLKMLVAGNQRYASGHLRHPHQTTGQRRKVVAGQHPLAAVLSCADSRVPPEIIFDEGLGDLFVTRVAGNTADNAVLGSLEYSAEHLHVPVIVVLGHTGCGAVAAAVEGGEIHDHVQGLVDALKPAVDKARSMSGDVKANAVYANVDMIVDRLRTSEPTLGKLVREHKLRIVGAVYHLDTGKIDWVRH